MKRLRRWIAWAAAAFAGVVVLYRWVPPPVTPLMLLRARESGITKTWVPLDAVSPTLVRAVIAAEDGRFFTHGGVDWVAARDAREYNARHGGAPRRGASTITMQCARNVFLWPGKTWIRKTVEVVLAYAIEAVWGKRRILEVYLNVIEWGPGVYGAEAAARASFGVAAADLDPPRAALLAAVLPNPRRWAASHPTSYVLGRAGVILRRAAGVRLDALDVR